MQERLFLRKKYKFFYKFYLNNSSKVLFTWEFVLKGTYHKIELWDSRLSGKKKLAVDDEVIAENKNSVAVFNYSFQLDSHYFNLVQINDSKYDIKINDILFSDLKEAELSGNIKKPQKKEKDSYNYEDNDKSNKNKDSRNNNDISYNNNDEDKGLID